MRREFSESQPELMDLPDQDENALRADLEHLGRLNRDFGGRRAVEKVFQKLADKSRKLLLIDIASGYSDHGRNLLAITENRHQNASIVAVDFQFQTLKIARAATHPDKKIFFVQADARQLPFRNKTADLAFCSLALHHFAEKDAVTILKEMDRIARSGTACIDLARSRLATIGIWFLTTFIIRDPMVRHDARLSVRRSFSYRELNGLARKAGWSPLEQTRFFCFQQAVTSQAHS